MKTKITLTWLVLLGLLTGCANDYHYWEAKRLQADGKQDEAMTKLTQLSIDYPHNAEYKMALSNLQERQAARLIADADNYRLVEDFANAAILYNKALKFQPGSPRAKAGLELIERDRNHARLLAEAEQANKKKDFDAALDALNLILGENPAHTKAKNLKRLIDAARNRETMASSPLKAALKKPITLEFRNAPLQSIFEVIARSAGVSFIFDRDLRADLKATIFARNTSVEDAINVLLATNQLEKKILNDSTLLIYPNQPAKQKEYQELVVKSFYLGNADPKQTLNLIKTVVKTRDVYIDERLNLLVMRDTPEAIRVAEKLIASHDLAEAEVVLDVEVLEVSSDFLMNLGAQFPEKLSFSVNPVSSGDSTAGTATTTAGSLSWDQLRQFNSKLVNVNVGDPAAVLHIKNTTGATNILANPRIRVKNREKAKVHVGDRVPVVTTTTNGTSGAISENVNYLDVGVLLEVEPQVYLDSDVGIKVSLEVSNIVKQITTKNGLIAYQLGSRKANTVLRLKDGETQMLAGLVSKSEREDADRLPGLGNIPLLGRLFSRVNNENNKTEIVLLITPRIVRTLALPQASDSEFMSGTEGDVSTTPLRLKPSAAVDLRLPTGGAEMPAPAYNPQPQMDQQLPQPGAQPFVPSRGAPTPAATPGGAPLKASLSTPPKARVGQEFSVNVTADIDTPASALATDVIFNPAYLEMTSARAGDLARNAQFSSQNNPGRVALMAQKQDGMRGHGTFATIGFRVREKTSLPLWIGIGQLQASNTQGTEMPVAASEPKSLEIE